jgi:type I restriction enzyme R subunit
VFGDYVSIYDIQDAVDDGATVPIYYESRLAKLDLNHEELETLSDQVDELVEDEETGQQEKPKVTGAVWKSWSVQSHVSAGRRRSGSAF